MSIPWRRSPETSHLERQSPRLGRGVAVVMSPRGSQASLRKQRVLPLNPRPSRMAPALEESAGVSLTGLPPTPYPHTRHPESSDSKAFSLLGGEPWPCGNLSVTLQVYWAVVMGVTHCTCHDVCYIMFTCIYMHICMCVYVCIYVINSKKN